MGEDTKGEARTHFASASRSTPAESGARAAAVVLHPLAQQVIDAMPSIVLVLDENRQAVAGNAAFAALAGTPSPDAYLGRRPGEILDCVNAWLEKAGCGTSAFCSTCGAVQAIVRAQQGHKEVGECRIVARDGQAYDLRVTASPLELAGQRYTIFAVEDIAHQKRREALERVFFHDVSNAATLAMLLALELEETVPAARDRAVDLHDAVQRIASEVSTQKTLLAAESGQLHLQLADLHTLSLLHDIVQSHRPLAAAGQVQLAVTASAEDLPLRSDPVLLGRVLSNMVKNAVEASKPGQRVTLGARTSPRGAGEARTSPRRAGEARTQAAHVEFWVHNVGHMPDEVAGQVFQRSFSTKGVGRGLGTYSMRLLLERFLGGEVSFSSEPHEGTTFRARLPARPPTPPRIGVSRRGWQWTSS